MPGRGKSYETFQRDDQYCQSSAQQAIGYQSPGEAANQTTVRTAASGTAIGAIAGAALGSVSGNMGTGAALGAGTGLVSGSAIALLLLPTAHRQRPLPDHQSNGAGCWFYA